MSFFGSIHISFRACPSLSYSYVWKALQASVELGAEFWGGLAGNKECTSMEWNVVSALELRACACGPEYHVGTLASSELDV